MNNFKKILLCSVLINFGCNKAEFLDKKPSSDLTVPQTLNDFQNLLESADAMNNNGSLAQINSDEYQVTYQEWQNALSETERNSYVWAKDLFGGDLIVLSWSFLYSSVFYSNAILEGLEKSNLLNSSQGQYLKGWAHFSRAYAFFDLTRNFCKSYDATSSNTESGIPLRLSSNIDYTLQRSSLQKSYDQILADLEIAEALLPPDRPTGKLNRPSRIAVYALLARIYLDMRNYDLAEKAADKCLSLYNKLVDYKTISKTSTTPFSTTNDEIIFYALQVPDYGWTTNAAIGKTVSTELINLYANNDIRLLVFYNKLSNGLYAKKRSYAGFGNYPFTGLATDEVYLIKGECLARRGDSEGSMSVLNKLVINRWDPNASIPAAAYQNIIANDPEDALAKVLLERRKELAWRGIRWFDLKRLNKEGANITLTRVLNGITYNLPPNDNRYVFPIPNDEINLSRIQQNER